MLDAPWYASNQTIHTDLETPFIEDLIKSKSQLFHYKLSIYPNSLLLSYLISWLGG
jgi:hypothetical protein